MNKDFAKIKTTIWNSDKFYSLTPNQKIFYLYCHTNRHVNSCGCYFMHHGYMMADLNFTEKEIIDAINACQKSGLIRYNQENKIVYIERFFDINSPNNPKHALKVISDIKNIPYINFLASRMQELRRVIEGTDWKITKDLLKEIDTVSIPNHHIDIDIDIDIDVDKYIGENEKADQIPENADPETGEIFDLEQEDKNAEKKLNDALEEIFNRWWKTYPDFGMDGARGSAYRGNKKTAREKFLKLISKAKNPQAMIELIADGTDRYRNFLEENGTQQAKHAITWLNQEGWNDDYQLTKTENQTKGKTNEPTIDDVFGELAEELGFEGETETDFPLDEPMLEGSEDIRQNANGIQNPNADDDTILL